MITREVLNADGMSLAAYVSGLANAGIGITGTWVGTIYFEEATIDNPNVWIASSQTPFASGTAVSSITANGNYFSPIKANVFAKRARFVRTSGSAQISIAAAVDSSWQDAFLTSSTIANSSSATSGANTLTQASQANRAWKLTFCEVSIAGPSFGGGVGRIDIYDGTIAGTKLYTAFLTQSVGSVGMVQKINLPTDADGKPSLVNTPGNAMTIVVSGLGGQASIINTNFTAA